MLSRSVRVQLFAAPWTVAHQEPCPWDFTDKNAGFDCHSLLHLVPETLHKSLGGIATTTRWRQIVAKLMAPNVTAAVLGKAPKVIKTPSWDFSTNAYFHNFTIAQHFM